jgi:hypothetical protein
MDRERPPSRPNWGDDIFIPRLMEPRLPPR